MICTIHSVVLCLCCIVSLSVTCLRPAFSSPLSQISVIHAHARDGRLCMGCTQVRYAVSLPHLLPHRLVCVVVCVCVCVSHSACVSLVSPLFRAYSTPSCHSVNPTYSLRFPRVILLHPLCRIHIHLHTRCFSISLSPPPSPPLIVFALVHATCVVSPCLSLPVSVLSLVFGLFLIRPLGSHRLPVTLDLCLPRAQSFPPIQ